ncbi:unnamed protein product [Acidithrix sp. C25]|nr:unnamed protein product [Acidithrix sp. C25]
MRDLSKPRALTVNMSSRSLSSSNDDALSIPVIGLIAAGSGALALENPTDEVALIPAFLGDATTLFALRVKGDSMIGDGIFERDIIVARKQSTATTGELVIAGLRDETEATVKRIEIDRAKNRIVLKPSNPAYSPMQYPMDQVAIYGRVVFLQRQF